MMNKEKRVLVVATSSKTRGGITAVINAYTHSFLWKKWNCKWIETHIDRSFLVKIVYFVKAFLSYVYYLPKSSLIHCHLSGQVSTVRKIPFLLLAKLFKKPIIIHFHAFSPESSFDKKYYKLYKLVFSFANKIIVLSENWKQNIIKDLKLAEFKVKVIANPCANITNYLNVKKENIILFAGTMNKRKGYHDLIKAFSLLPNELQNWKLYLAGNGEIEEAKILSNKFNVQDSVVFLGWISDEKKHEVFSKSTIFCLPSYAEGFPMAILDAWSYGLPVITTPVGGIPDVGLHKKNMMLATPGDIIALKDNLEILIKDTLLREKLIEASLKFSGDTFSIEKLAVSWDELYENLILQ